MALLSLPSRLVGGRAILPVILVLSASFLSSSDGGDFPSGCCQSIISFGDSLADTGNLLRLRPSNDLPRSANPPYGRTFFHRPNGRFSDGRLVIDFLAEKLGLPFAQPYIHGGGNFSKGVNFAVAGATALEYGFYEERGILNPDTNVSLGTQLDWFKQFLASVPDGRKYLLNALVLVGEIGGNDYNYPLLQNNTEMVQSLVPLVVNFIGSTIEELIKLGAQTMLVPGNLPIGCLSTYLSEFSTDNEEDYDPRTGCINWLNKIPEYHNELLQKELNRIRELHPHVSLLYADYYNAMIRLYLSPQKFGFTKGVFRACCGSGGPYNVNQSALCGVKPATSCDDPSSYINWDGVHSTEAAYRLIAQAFIEGPYTTPDIRGICPYVSGPSQVYGS